MSLKLAIEALKKLGLTETDAKVYIYLAKKGPLEEKDLAKKLKLTQHQLCISLKKLLTKGMVNSFTDRSTKYSAIAFEKVLDQFMKSAKKQAKTLKANREELLSTWQTMIEENFVDTWKKVIIQFLATTQQKTLNGLIN